ncbi:MAG: prepilin-type N-terminal cleavage/methylation domain-containing protein [Desulfobulbus sp.]|nr:prepilin-type N-terminal cleavage/methylation domain-containing protein [Desulfobulbus sp.]
MANQTGTDQWRKQRGFTLVELLVATAVGGVLMGAVMTAFLSQHETYIVQDDVVEMQQNARVAMDMLTRDIRSIGYDPGSFGAALKTPGIGADGATQGLVFTRWHDDTAAMQEVEYALIDAFASVGGNDGRVDDLGRRLGTEALQPVAENVSQLEFRYLDGDGNPTSLPNNVRAIQVSIMVESANQATKAMPPPQTYTTPGGQQWTPADGFRSIFLTATVRCRNLGL